MFGCSRLTSYFRVEGAQIILIDADETLFPVPGTRDHLANFLGLFLLGERAYPIAWDNVLEDRSLGDNGELADKDVIGHRLGVGH